MNQPPPLFRDQRKVDADHLKLLSIFHFVGAGLALAGLLFLCLHFAMFHAFMDNPKMWENQKQAPPLEFFAIFKWFYLVFALWIGTSLVLNVLAGLWIHRSKHRTWTLVVAGINCLHVPLGTILGVFTIIVLVRDSVRDLYTD